MFKSLLFVTQERVKDNDPTKNIQIILIRVNNTATVYKHGHVKLYYTFV